MAVPRTPGQRAGLSHPQVLAAAREVLAQGGLEALTMRAVARRLGVAPNALYSHVSDKTALIDDLLDELLASVNEPADGEDWQAQLRTIMTSSHRQLLAHPDLVPLYLARQGARGPNAQRLGELMLAALAQGGVTGTRAHEAQLALIIHAIGSAAFVAPDGGRAGGRGPPASSEGESTPRAELVQVFERGLEWLIAGIAASRGGPLGAVERRQSPR